MKTGFTPTPTFKKLLKKYNSYVCVYRDGLDICEKRTVSVGQGLKTEITVHHIYPCAIMIDAYRYTDPGKYSTAPFPVSYVHFYEARSLMDGVDNITVYTNTTTPSMQEKIPGVTLTNVYVETPDDGRHTHTEIDELAGGGFALGSATAHIASLRELYEHIRHNGEVFITYKDGKAGNYSVTEMFE